MPSYQATLSEDAATPEAVVPHVQSQFVTVLPPVVVVGVDEEDDWIEQEMDNNAIYPK